jgi:hypothetical protein
VKTLDPISKFAVALTERGDCFAIGGMIVKRCSWIQIKFISEDSNGIHSIITTI